MKKIIAILMFNLLFVVSYGNFQIAPQIQTVNLERPSTNKIYLRNDTNKLKKIKVYARRPKDQKSEDLYMGDWIIVYPKIIYLKPNSKKTVRMTARPPKGLAPGEYRSELVFEEEPVKKYDTNEAGEGKVGVNVEVLYVLVSTVYGYVGELEYKGTSEDYKVVVDGKKTYLTSKVTNTGTTALDIIYKVTYYDGSKKLKEEELKLGKVMRENSKDLVILLKNISKNANKMKVEFFYRVENSANARKKGEGEYREVKLGEKIIPIKRITKEEYFKSIKGKDKKK